MSFVNPFEPKNNNAGTGFVDPFKPTGPTLQRKPVTPAAPPEKSGLIRRVVGDTLGVDLIGRGTIAFGEGAVGIANLATGGYAGKGLEAIGYDPKRTHEMLSELYSPERKLANEKVAQAEGFVDTAAAMLENPSTIAGGIAQSVPSILGGGALARGVGALLSRAATPGLAAIPYSTPGRLLLGAGGEGAMMAGAQAEAIRQQTDDGLLTPEQSALAAGTGVIGGGLGIVGGNLARKLGIGDVDTLAAGGVTQAVGDTAQKGMLRRAAEGALVEGAFEEVPQSVAEQALQNIALDNPVGEGLGTAAAAGLLTGSALGGVIGALDTPQPLADNGPARTPPPPAPITEAALRAAVETAPTPEAKAQAQKQLADLIEQQGRMLPAPGQAPITVNADGEARTPAQTLGVAQQRAGELQAQADIGLTPDVLAAQKRDPRATLQRFPNAAPGSLADVANVLTATTPTTPPAPNLVVAEDPAIQRMTDKLNRDFFGGQAPAPTPPPGVDAQTGELDTERGEEAARRAITDQLEQGRVPDLRLIAGATGVTPRRVSDIRAEIAQQRKAEAKAKAEGKPSPQEALPLQSAATEQPAPSPSAESGESPQQVQAVTGAASADPIAAPQIARAPLSVRMGDQEYPVDSAEDASRKFLELKERGDIGGMQAVRLIDRNGDEVGFIGQSGEVYDTPLSGIRANPNAQPVYRPPSNGRGDAIEGEATAIAGDIQAPASPEAAAAAGIVPVKSVDGSTVYVKQADVDRKQGAQLPLYDKAGARLKGKTIHRDNLDPTGEKFDGSSLPPQVNRSARGAKNDADAAFKTAAAALNRVQKQGLPAEAYEAKPAGAGFVAVLKPEFAGMTVAQARAKIDEGFAPAPATEAPPAEQAPAAPEQGGEESIAIADLEDDGRDPEADARSFEEAQKEWAENLGFKVGDRVRSKNGGPVRVVTALFGKYVAYRAHPDNPADLSTGTIKATNAIRVDDGDAAGTAKAEREALPNATAPEQVQPEELGVTVDELAKIATEFRRQIDDGKDAGVTRIFESPKPKDVVRLAEKAKVYHKNHGWMTPAEAKARIAEWKAAAKAQGKAPETRSENANRIVLSLFDLTGSWSKPWEEAGYQVYRFDIQNEDTYEDPETGEQRKIGDVRNMSVEFFADLFGDFDGNDIHAVLAACPCTDFAVSGARHFAAKDADGRTVASVELVKKTLALVEYYKPAVWAVENPVGRIEKLTGLPPWRLSFDPNHVGDPYTKKTLLWGRFNADLPIAPVEPTEGSKMHRLYGGSSMKTKNARSETPEGFSYAFFAANNAADHPLMTLANKYDRLPQVELKKALDAGLKPAEISNAVDDPYYIDLDDEAAVEALREAIADKAGDLEALYKDGDRVIVNGREGKVLFQYPGTGVPEYSVEFENGNGRHPQSKLKPDPAPKADKAEQATPSQETFTNRAAESAAIQKSNAELGAAATVYKLPGKQKEGMPAAEVMVAKDGDVWRYSWQWNTNRSGSGGPFISANDTRPTFSSEEAATIAGFEMIEAKLPKRNVDPSEAKQIEAIKTWIDQRKRDVMIPAAAAEAATSPTNDLPAPTEAQKEAGNYKKGHITLNGLDITIENPAGSKRREDWPALAHHYGYIKRTEGADGDHVDVFMSDDAANPDLPVFVVDQRNRDGKFDEHKVMLGFADEAAARAGYLANYTKGWKGLGAITPMTLDEFKGWLREGDTTKPAAAAEAPKVTLATWRDATPPQRRAMLDRAGFPQEEGGALLAGLAWNKLTDPVRKALSALPADQAYNPTAKAAETPNDRTERNSDGDREAAARGDSSERPAAARDDDSAVNLDGRQPEGAAQAGEGREPAAETAQPGSEPRGSGGRDGVDGERDGGGSPADVRAPTHVVSARNNFTITNELDFTGAGEVTKFKGNVEAIRLLKALEAEGRNATDAEQSVLAKFVGWGGLPKAFDPKNTDWAERYAELKGLLTDEEWNAAARSTQDAHYTSREVVEGMWAAVRRLGFNGGRVLEPSMGTGNFFGLMPQDLRSASRLSGVELDSITGRIAKKLYPKASVTVRGFNDTRIQPDTFDLAIGNPPFGSQAIFDAQYPEESKQSIHNFFFMKSLASVRPGGVMAMVVSNFLMDAQTSTSRQWMSERARLLGAFRLPNTAFKSNAGTSVTTDIVVFQRLAPGEQGNPDAWVKTGEVEVDGQKHAVNQWFVDHPEALLGELKMSTHTTYGRAGLVLEPKAGESLATRLAAAVDTLPQGAYTPAGVPIGEAKASTETPAEAADTRVYGHFLTADGRLMQRQPDYNGTVTATPLQLEGAALERMKGMVGVRQVARELIQAESDPNATDAKISELRAELNKRYDGFVKEHGYLSRDVNKRLFREDPDGPLLISLEKDYDRGVSRDAAKKAGVPTRKESASKADIFSKRTNYPVRPTENVKDAKSAMLASLNERGRIDIEFVRRVYKKGAYYTEADFSAELGDLVFNDGGELVPADAYLSGNVKAKLAAAIELAKKNPSYQRNVEALAKVQPPDKNAVDIFVRLGTPWIPTSDYAAFANETFEGTVAGNFLRAIGRWEVTVNSRNATLNNERWGTPRMSASAILEALMGNKPIVIYDKAADDKRILNQEATAAAKGKAAELEQAFAEWVWKDAERRERLARYFNDTFNTDVPRKFDGSHLTLPGMNRTVLDGGALRPHQSAYVYRALQDGRALADHVVGAGKTYAAIATVMEMRRLGISRKPMVVVPNHLVDQWAKDFVKLYPGANILAASRKDFEKGNRQRLFSRIATGDWDAVIVAHSSFGFIPLPPEQERKILDEQVAEIQAAVAQLRKSEGKSSLSVKQLAKQQEALEEKLERLAKRPRDQIMDFAEMGIDSVTLDEAHEFKNLFFATSLRGVAGLGSPAGSKKSFDLFVKTRYLMDRNGDKGVFFLTGTPVSNTLSEVFHMQRYLQFDALKERGLHTFDAWAGTFGAIVSDWEMDAAGRFKEKSRFAKFANMKQLTQIWGGVADVVTRGDLMRDAEAQGKRFPLPKLKTGKPINVVAQRSPLQANFIGVPIPATNPDGTPKLDPETGVPLESYAAETIIYRMDNMPKDPKEDNHLKATNDARKAGLDFRLIEPSAPDFAGSKVNEAVSRVLSLWKANDGRKGTQLIFSDLSVPASARGKATEKAQAKVPTFFTKVYGSLQHVDGKKLSLSGMPDRAFFVVKTGRTWEIRETGSGVRVSAATSRQDAIDDANAELAADAQTWTERFESQAIPAEKIEAYVARWEEAQALKDAEADAAEDDDAPAEDDSVSMDDLLADESKFSVYDDIKAKLIAAGMPAEQVAFIHDYDTDLQKAALFAKVNSGEIRVLLGSTKKMGAGMNVQRKLVALHHLDAPWRPSDLEQRDGRIIRQGNEFYTADPDGFEIEIYRYSTGQTYDARQWEIIEVKARGIEDFRSGQKDEIEDVTGEAASAADMKGAASGNPLILESIKLRKEVKELEAQERQHRSSMYSMESLVRSVKDKSNYAYKALAAAKKIGAAIKPADPFTITIGGKTYTEKADIKPAAFAAVFKEVIDGGKQSTTLGTYRGVELIVTRPFNAIRVTGRIEGEDVGSTEFGPDDAITTQGTIARIENIVKRGMALEQEAAGRVAKVERESEQAAEELKRGFPRAAELEQKRTRQKAVVQALRSGKRAVDGDAPAKDGDAALFSQPAPLQGLPVFSNRAKVDARLAEVFDSYENGETLMTARDLLDEVEFIISDSDTVPQPVIDAAEAYRQEIEDDERLYGGRGADGAEDRFTDALAAAVSESLSAPAGRTGGIDAAELTTAIDAITDRWQGDAPPVSVKATPADLPPELAKKQDSQTAEGVYWRGRVYLIASNLSSIDRARQVLAHEAFGHYGVEGVVGDKEWGIITRDIGAMRKRLSEQSDVMRELLQDVQSRYPDASPEVFAKEAIAVMAENGVQASVLNRVVAAVRRFLRRLGMVDGFNETDLRDLVTRGMRRVEGRQFGAAQTIREVMRRGAPAFSAAVSPIATASRVLRLMARHDALFKFKKSAATTLDGVFKDVAPQFIVAPRGDLEISFEHNDRKGRHAVTADVFQIREEGKEKKARLFVERGGKNRMFLDISEFKSGEGLGAGVYAGLFNYAHNTGKVFIGDPTGLSDEALLRRTEHMLSAALKFGTTRMMEPHPRQVDPRGQFEGYKPQTWAHPLEWVTGNDTHNIAALLETSYHNHRQFLQGVPGVRDAIRAFPLRGDSGIGGEALPDGRLVELAREAGARFAAHPGASFGESREAAIGPASVARYLLTESALQDAGSDQRLAWVVDVAERLSSGSLTPAERGIFYSQPGPDAAKPGEPLFSQPPSTDDVGDALRTAAKPPKLSERVREAWEGGDIQSIARKGLLYGVTLRHISELAGDLLPALPTYVDTVQQMATDRNQMQESAAELADSWEKAQRKDRRGADSMANLMHDATIAGVDPDVPYEPLTMAVLRPTTVDGKTTTQRVEIPVTRRAVDDEVRALKLRRRTGDDATKAKIDQQIDQLEERLAEETARSRAYPALLARWQELPDNFKDLYRTARQEYVDQSRRYEDALVARIESMMEEGKQRAAYVAQVRQHFESQRLKGPYFPLSRFGSFWISATDKDGADAFFMFEKKGEWRRAQADLKSRGYTIKAASEKFEDASAKNGPSSGFMADLMDTLAAAGVDEEAKDQVYQLYLRSLPDLSVRKHFIHRKKVAGYSQDALRAFSGNLFHGSFQIARLRHTHTLDLALRGMKDRERELAKTNPEDAAKAAQVLNEMTHRHEWVMNPKDSAVANSLTSLGFVWYLGVSPAAALINLSQVPIVSFPVLAAKWGAGKASRAILDGMKRAISSVNGDITRGLSEEERRAFKVWYESGGIDKSMAHGLAGLSESDTQAFSPVYRRTMEIVSWLFHKAEVVNREATALAAFRLARDGGMSFDQATRYAEDTIWESQFDYTNANRARWMQGNVAKVVFLFRQYSLNMTWFLWRNAYQALKGERPEVKREAQRKLAGVLGMTGLFSGLLGMPLANVMFGLANAAAVAFGDDEEPWDAEVAFRNFLADFLGPDAARALTGGAVEAATGLEVSSRTSLNDLWIREPDRELEGEALGNYILQTIAGPMGGIGFGFLRGAQLMEEGHYWRALEATVPKFIRDGLRSIRYSTEGVNNLRGDPIIPELELGETIAQLSGFGPSRLADQYDANNAVKGYEERLLKKRQRLLNAFAMAAQAGDEAALRDTLARVRRWNSEVPALAIDGDSIRRSMAQRARYSERAAGGVVVDRRIEQQARAQARFAEGS